MKGLGILLEKIKYLGYEKKDNISDYLLMCDIQGWFRLKFNIHSSVFYTDTNKYVTQVYGPDGDFIFDGYDPIPNQSLRPGSIIRCKGISNDYNKALLLALEESLNWYVNTKKK